MYNIIQLNDKNLSELQQIAKELGLKKVDSLKKEELVYRILDEQAIVGATKKVAAQQNNEERKEGQPRKRSRISIKKEGDKVYTATKDKAQKLEANTPALPAPTPLFKEIPASPEKRKSLHRLQRKQLSRKLLLLLPLKKNPKPSVDVSRVPKINLLWQKKRRKPLKVHQLKLLPNRLRFLSMMTTWNFHRST